ncbi:MAG: tyrosine-type recombinase/integrase [bacterium]
MNTDFNIFIKALVTEANKNTITRTMELETALETFINFKKNKVRTATIEYYRKQLKEIFIFLKNSNVKSTQDITRNLLIQFQHQQLNKGLKPQTINKRTTCLITMLKELSELELISYDPINLKTLNVKQTTIEVVESHNIPRILNYANTLNSNANLLLKLLITSGIRTSEVIQIKNKNIFIKDKYILLEHTKSGYERILPLVEDIIPLLEQVKSNRVYLFSNTEETHFKPSFVRSIIARTKKALNIEVLSAHKLRHSFATFHCKNGTNLKVLQELLGHRSILMTQRYIDLSKEDLISANNKCNLINHFK